MTGIVAPRTYHPGDLIYEEKAFAIASFNSEACETCFKRSPDLKSCKSCLEVKYCSKECQKADWNEHKLECEHMKNLTKSCHRSFVRLLGKVILKVKDKDWKSIQLQVVNTSVTFDDIGHDNTDGEENLKSILYREEMKELTRKYIGEQNMPTAEDFHKIIGKVLSCSMFKKSIPVNAGFVFLGLSQFTEECIPNTNYTTHNNMLKIWACKEIKKESEKITVKTSDQLPRSYFKKVDTMNNKCKCTDCALPYGESILSRIVDEKRAFSVISETECLLNTVNCLSGLPFSPSSSQVDELLKRQEEVLGDTHTVHLKLLQLKCFELVDHPFRLKESLKKYEECTRKAYGEYSMELIPIYKRYIGLCFQLGYILEAASYMDKLRKVDIYSR